MNVIERDSSLATRRSRTLRSEPDRVTPLWWWAAKRGIDVLVSTTALIVFAPVIAFVACGVVLVSRGSPFFTQQRVGLDGKTFRMFKLRSMVNGAHLLHEDVRHLNEVSGPVLKIKRDPRLHAFGAFIRRTSIDELPNFINVLRGEMSVVGPRPPLPSEVEHYNDRALRRLTVKPGITCLWQITGRSNISFEQWMELDNQYIDTWTPISDVLIIMRTIPAVIRGNGAH